MRISYVLLCYTLCFPLILLGQLPYVNPLTLFQAYESTVPTADLPRVSPQRATHYNARYVPQGTPINNARITLQRFRDDHYRPVADTHRLYLYDDSLRFRHTFLPTGYYQLTIDHPDYVRQVRWVQLKRLQTADGYRTYASFGCDFYSVLAPVYTPFLYKKGERVLHEGRNFVFPLYLYPAYETGLIRPDLLQKKDAQLPRAERETLYQERLMAMKEWIAAFAQQMNLKKSNLTETIIATTDLSSAEQEAVFEALAAHPQLEVNEITLAYELGEELPSKIRSSHTLSTRMKIYLHEHVIRQPDYKQRLEALLNAQNITIYGDVVPIFEDAHGQLIATYSHAQYYGSMHPEVFEKRLKKLYSSGYINCIVVEHETYP